MGLLQATTGDWQVEGVDISAQMLQTATQTLTGAAALTLHHVDVCHLPQTDNCADLVISAHMLEHLTNPLAGLREMWRVLKPDAPVVIFMTRSGWYAAYLRYRWGVRGVTEEEIGSWLRVVGFVVVRNVPLRNLLSLCTWSGLVCVGCKLSIPSNYQATPSYPRLEEELLTARQFPPFSGERLPLNRGWDWSLP